MSQFNLRYVPTLSCNEFILNGQRFNTQGAPIGNINTTPLTTQVIINDQTKNQALLADILLLDSEIQGNVKGNLAVVDARLTALEGNVAILQTEMNAVEGNVAILQTEMNAVEGNVTILQGNVVNLQNQISVLTGNIIIDEELIAELQRDTQFLEAPYAGLVGNTSYFVNGLQMWSGANENGNGLFVYKDAGAGNVGLNQIRLGVEDNKNILIAGGSQFLQPVSTGAVTVKNTDGNFTFKVGDRATANFYDLSKTELNGNISLNGQDNNYVHVYTQPAQVLPLPSPAVKKVEIRGDQELNMTTASLSILTDAGGSLTGTGGSMRLQGGSAGYFDVDKNPRIFAQGGSNPGSIDIQIGDCDLNKTGTIRIGTEQSLLEAGFKEIYIGQNGPPTAARTSSTLLDGDTYLPQNLVTSPNLGGWDNIVYLGLPTAFSGPLRGPVKKTYTPYVKSISCFSAVPTINSFISSSGTFTVAVGLGAITLNAGAGGCLINTAAGLCSLTSLVGGIGLTTAGGAIAMTTGAGIIQMTTGAAPIAMETNIGDILLKAGYSNQSTPELSLGSVYIQARDYNYITPDKGVIIGEGIVTPFNEVLFDTMSYPFTGNLFSNIGTPSNLFGVYSNSFISPGSKTTLLNPVTSNLIYVNELDESGQAQSVLLNVDINPATIIALSQLATVPAGNVSGNITNYITNFYFPDNTILPLNANLKIFAYPTYDTSNIGRYQYTTWQSNIQIQSNISGFVKAYVEPNPPSYENYMTVLGNVGILADCDVGGNLTVASSSFPAQQTLITRNSVTTTGDVTCQTLNYTTLNPPIVFPNIAPGVDSIIAGTNIAISPLNGIGNVVINCTLPNVAGVSQIIAGNGIQINPVIGTGVVTVALAGSVIPPGGYLPIAGGIMTGEIHQTPSSGNLQDNTVKLYRPQTSYQPPYPSIGPPTFTGELLTFFNGDNSPQNLNFTGWFPQNTFYYEPDVITETIFVGGATIYESTGGGASGRIGFLTTPIPQFKVGDHITGAIVYISEYNTIQGQLLAFLTGDSPNGPYDTLYKIDPGTPPGPYPTDWNIALDFTYTGGQKAYNVFQIQVFDGYETPGFLNTIGARDGDFTYFQGQITLAGNATPTHFIGAQGDTTTSVLYEYFPLTGLISKLLAVNKTGGLGKIYGIYSEDVETSREIIVYGDFTDVLIGDPTPVTLVNQQVKNLLEQFYVQLKDIGGFVGGADVQTYSSIAVQSVLQYTGGGSASIKVQLRNSFTQDLIGESPLQYITGNEATYNFSIPELVLPGGSQTYFFYWFVDNWSVLPAGSLSYQSENGTQKPYILAVGKLTNVIICNNIFQYEIDTNVVTQLTTQTSDPAYATNKPKGVNGAVYGVEKQVSNTSSRRVWMWGDFNGVAQMGNPSQPTDCTLKGGCNCTTSDNWSVAIEWDSAYALGQGPFNCRGGKIIANVANTDPQTDGFLLLVYAGGRFTDTAFNQLTMIYYNSAIAPGFLTSTWPFNNGSITSPFSKAVDYITIIDNQIIMTGEYTGTAQGPSVTDIPVYSIMRAAIGTWNIGSGKYSSPLVIFADSGNASFWVEGTNQIGVTRIKNLANDTSIVLGTTGYGTTALGGGVLTFPSTEIQTLTEPAIKYPITNVPPYSVFNVVAGNDPTKVRLSCSLNEDNYWFSQTFNSTITPDPPGNQPVVNAINGAKFLVDNHEMTKIVFSANVQQNYASVSFIAGDATNDTNWYWYSQVGAIDYFAGNVFYPNVTSSPSVLPTTSTLGQVMLNGAIASTALDMNDFNIVKANTIFSDNILTLNPFNGVEVGLPQRREELVAVEVSNSGALTGQNNFDAVSGVIQGGGFTVPTTNIYVTTINASSGFDDGMSGNSTIQISLIQDDGGTETILGGENFTTGSGLSTYNIVFSPAITINPSPTKTYFVRMSVPPASPMYSYYGTISDGLTPAIIVTANTLQQVSDPVEYFNVYGNCFFQDNVLIHATQTIENPAVPQYTTVYDYNQIQLLSPSFTTQMGAGQTFITSGVSRTITNYFSFEASRTDITLFSRLDQNSFIMTNGIRTARIFSNEMSVGSTSGPIASGALKYGLLELNNNEAGGSNINLNKDSISVATDVISTINSSTKDANGTSRIFTRLQSRTSAVGTGNQDGTFAISTLVNGVLLEVFNFHGGENENNSFRSLDMNGNSVRTTQGNIVVTAVASSGIGNATIQSKAGATINIDSGATGRVNWNTLTATATPTHNVDFRSTSNGVTSASYLKMQLNGVDIWVPYLTTDPTL